MTLRKYKKMLMSYGIDRDLAEAERISHSHRKKISAREGEKANDEIAINRIVQYRKETGTTSLRRAVTRVKALLAEVINV